MIGYTFKYLKPLSLLLAITFLFQGCKVYIYQKESTTIEEAINSNAIKLKVITYDERKYIFNSLYYKGDILYG
jgi:hypothetical protein